MLGIHANRPISARVWIFLLASLTAAIASPPSALASPVELAPISPWNVNYGEESCKLIRAFGSEDSPVTISYERFGPAEWGSMVLIGKRLASNAVRRNVRVWFGDTPPKAAQSAFNGTVSTTHTPLVIVSTVANPAAEGATRNTPDPQLEKLLNRLTFESEGHILFTLLTGRMDQPFTAMRKCTSALVKEWGLDPDVQDRLSRGPQPLTKPTTWIQDNDFPYIPLIEGESGIVHFRLIVGTDGVPTKCVIQSKTSPDSFAPMTCQLLLKRARFAPGLDANGQPVETFYISSVRYQHMG